MKKLSPLVISLLLLAGCTSTSTMLKNLYGHPSYYSSADDWMANSYLKAAYVDGEPIYYTVTGVSNEVFTTRESALRRMKSAYSRDYQEFFLTCFEMHQRGEVCKYFK